MIDFFFIIKSTIFTVLVVLMMQIKIGPSTLEDKFHKWVKSSSAVQPLQEVADGALRKLGATVKTVKHEAKKKGVIEKIKSKIKSESYDKGERYKKLFIERSEEYLNGKKADPKDTLVGRHFDKAEDNEFVYEVVEER